MNDDPIPHPRGTDQAPTPRGGDLLHDEISRAAQAFADAAVAFDERTRERDSALADRDRAREQARQLRDELADARSELSAIHALLEHHQRCPQTTPVHDSTCQRYRGHHGPHVTFGGWCWSTPPSP
jgi:hypothetical protein